MNKTWAKKIMIGSTVLLLILVLYGKIPLPQILVYNTTASLPLGWYLILPSHQYALDDIVVFRLPPVVMNEIGYRKWIPQDGYFLKKIGAMPGQYYEININRELWIDGKYIGKAAENDHDQLSMPKMGGIYQVPDNEFLPISNHPNSFDGRYFGTIPFQNIKYKVIPLFTWY